MVRVFSVLIEFFSFLLFFKYKPDLIVLAGFFLLFDFGIEAPGTPQNAPLGLAAAGFDKPFFKNFKNRVSLIDSYPK